LFAAQPSPSNSRTYRKKILLTSYKSFLTLLFQGVSGFLFAFLPYTNQVPWFIGLSYLLRFLEGAGTAMAWSSALGILMKIFPNKVMYILGSVLQRNFYVIFGVKTKNLGCFLKSENILALINMLVF